MSHPTTPVFRSTVVRGIAWSVPAVAAVAAAPFAAASPTPYVLNFATGRATSTTPKAPALPVPVASGGPGTLVRTASQLTVNDIQTVTIDFGRDVINVSFSLADIDWYDNNGATGVKEVVAVAPAPSAVTTHGTTAANPFTAVTAGTTGAVDVLLAGPLRSVTIRLTNAATRGKATPDVLVQNLTFVTDPAKA